MQEIETKTLSEESRQLLRRIVESMAWRQLSSIDTLGHCLKYVVDIDNKLRVASELDLSLRLFREVRALYRELGWRDLEAAVRERMSEVQYPESRLEFGVAYYLTGLAEKVAMEAYTTSTCKPFAAIALSYVEASAGRPVPSRFEEFCAEPTNRPQAQQHLNRWLAFAMRSFGRPGTTNDDRALALGLRSKRAADLHEEFIDHLQPFLSRCGLELPRLEDYGIENGRRGLG